jgi:transcriptional regulator with XRE-family HTH domain
MNFETMTDKAILIEMGERIRARRLENNLTQGEVARKAGVGRNVIHNIENGNVYTIAGLIRVLRAIHLIRQMDLFVPDSGPSPLELIKLEGRRRKRATGRRKLRKENEK